MPKKRNKYRIDVLPARREDLGDGNWELHVWHNKEHVTTIALTDHDLITLFMRMSRHTEQAINNISLAALQLAEGQDNGQPD